MGIALANSASDLAAFAEAVTVSALMPSMDWAYFEKLSPNGTSSSAKVLSVLSPIRSASKPPWFGMALANSARVLAAFAEASMTSGLIPSIN